MLTIFSTPKPFKGHIRVIQENAIRSWAALDPSCEIILFGDEEGTAEIASELGIRHITDVGRNEYGTPLVSSMFETAQDVARHQIMCYVNADIILMSDFLPAIRQVTLPSFLVVGQRWDTDLTTPIDFNRPSWEDQVRTQVKETGKLHAPTGIDYFVFPRDLYRDLPSFAIGRAGWDNWMVYRARSRGIPVVDATRAITAVHQNHDYAHHPDGKAGVFSGAEANRNRQFLGGWGNSLCVNHATWILTSRGLRRALTPRYLYHRLGALPVVNPHFRFLAIPKRAFLYFYRIIKNR